MEDLQSGTGASVRSASPAESPCGNGPDTVEAQQGPALMAVPPEGPGPNPVSRCSPKGHPSVSAKKLRVFLSPRSLGRVPYPRLMAFCWPRGPLVAFSSAGAATRGDVPCRGWNGGQPPRVGCSTSPAPGSPASSKSPSVV